MFLTIFTPTYNRNYTLERLYASLCVQTDSDFEWVVVDDGSTDGSGERIQKWQEEKKIPIRYVYQENAGKPSAHNRGAGLAKGELFLCVDSDDYLKEDAVMRLKQAWREEHEGCIGILAYKAAEDGTPVTSCKNTVIRKTTLRRAYDVYGVRGDAMLVFQTNVLKKYEFPKSEGETFVPEGYLYDLLDREGELLFVREGLYICEYLPDGYTANMRRLLYNNPQGYFLYINQRLHFDEKAVQRFLDSIRYVGMALAHRKKHIIREAVYPFWVLCAYLPGYLFYNREYKELAK